LVVGKGNEYIVHMGKVREYVWKEKGVIEMGRYGVGERKWMCVNVERGILRSSIFNFMCNGMGEKRLLGLVESVIRSWIQKDYEFWGICRDEWRWCIIR
jgi:hypothetical protein